MQREYQGPPPTLQRSELSYRPRRANIDGVNASFRLPLIVELFEECPARLDVGSKLAGLDRPLRLHGRDSARPVADGTTGAACRRGLLGMLVPSRVSRDGPGSPTKRVRRSESVGHLIPNAPIACASFRADWLARGRPRRLENTFGIASTLGLVCLPLRRGLGGRDRLACTSVAQAIRIDFRCRASGERETDI